MSEFSLHEETKDVEYCEGVTRLPRRTVMRFLDQLRKNEDITKPAKRGRKPKYTPQLLKKVSQELCFKNKSLRDEKDDRGA